MQADAAPYYDNGNYINYHSDRNLEVMPLPGLNTVIPIIPKKYTNYQPSITESKNYEFS